MGSKKRPEDLPGIPSQVSKERGTTGRRREQRRKPTLLQGERLFKERLNAREGAVEGTTGHVSATVQATGAARTGLWSPPGSRGTSGLRASPLSGAARAQPAYRWVI
jgi:hypothetical protein